MAAVLKWQHKGSSNSQAHFATGLKDVCRVDGGSAMPSVIAGPAGAFGNLLQTNNAVYCLEWPCQDNGPIGKAGFTIGMSGNPNFTGTLSSARGGLFTIGCTRSQRGYFGGISIYIDTASKVRIGCGSRSSGGNYFNAVAFNYVVNFTQNTIKEIYVTWDGTTSVDGAKLWVCDRGGVPVNVASLTASAANTELWNRAAMASISNTNVADFTNTFLWDLEEVFILDEAVDVAAYFGGVARTNYVYTGAAYEGYNFTALTAPQVQSGVAFGPGPGTLTGTAVLAAAATTKMGVTANDGAGSYDGSDRWTDPGEANVSAGTAYKANSTTNNKLGTRQTVTNVIAAASLSGQRRSGTLRKS